MALREVLLEELRDLYSAENQLVKALPKMAKGANDPQVKQLFSEHLEETKGHVERLRQIFEMLETKPTGKHCKGMEGIINEGKEALEEDKPEASFDLGLTGGGLRVEYYEIAGYNAVIAMAKTLKLGECVSLLQQNLKEEEAAAKKLTVASKPLLQASAAEPEEQKKSRSSKKAAKKSAAA